MATYGWPSPNWTTDWEYYGWNDENNVAVPMTMPQAGTITDVVFNCDARAGSGSGMQALGCVWTANGSSLLGSGSTQNMNYVDAHQGPFTWHDSSGLSYAATLGEQLLVGWWRTPTEAAGDNLWGFANGGIQYLATTANSTEPGTFPTNASEAHQPGIYIIYTPAASPNPPAPPHPQFVLGTSQLIYELMREGLVPG